MKKQIKMTMMVALVAVAGLCVYKTYQDYKADKESDLVMQNIEVLTEDDVIGDGWYLHHFKCAYVITTDEEVYYAFKLFGRKVQKIS